MAPKIQNPAQETRKKYIHIKKKTKPTGKKVKKKKRNNKNLSFYKKENKEINRWPKPESKLWHGKMEDNRRRISNFSECNRLNNDFLPMPPSMSKPPPSCQPKQAPLYRPASQNL